jgi:hypothetical protein
MMFEELGFEPEALRKKYAAELEEGLSLPRTQSGVTRHAASRRIGFSVRTTNNRAWNRCRPIAVSFEHKGIVQYLRQCPRTRLGQPNCRLPGRFPARTFASFGHELSSGGKTPIRP